MKIKGFDENFVGRGFQDFDFEMRLKLLNGLDFIQPDVKNNIFCYHLHHTINKYKDSKYYFNNFIYFYKRMSEYISNPSKIIDINSIL